MILSPEKKAALMEAMPMMRQLLHDIAVIPAPSHHEEQRAAFVAQWLRDQGAEGVLIDAEKNVVFPWHCEGDRPIIVLMAHTDVVFPDTTPLPYHEEDGRICCPGIGDDTANLALLLMAIRHVLREGVAPRDFGLLFVANSGEEGLGNLCGCRQIYADYGPRMAGLITLDGSSDGIVNASVGSHRYQVTLTTPGGHSYGNFGNRNAIHALAQLIDRLYQLPIPEHPTARTTYNVGTIEGGTSVNTIAESATMLCEYRSDDVTCLRIMEQQFKEAFKATEADDVAVEVSLVGERPCAEGVDPEALDRLSRFAMALCERHTGRPCTASSGSTDANIPLAHGIPAVCMGTYRGAGAHTRGEWIEADSLSEGLCIVTDLVLAFC